MCERCSFLELTAQALKSVLEDQQDVIEGLRAELALSKWERRRITRASLVRRLVERLERYEDSSTVDSIVGDHLYYTETDRARRG